MNKFILFIITFLFSNSVFSQTEWKIDTKHSSINFSVSHLVVSETEGRFKNFDGKIISTKESFEDAEIEFTIDVNSIHTDNIDRDNHLKNDDFFAAEKFPQMKFKSSSFKKISENKYKLIGNMTIRDVTKKVELDVTYGGTKTIAAWNMTKAGFKISGVLNRFDFGLKFDKTLETGELIVGKDVEISCKIELDKVETKKENKK